MYLPKLNFTAVLPLPNTSYAAPSRGAHDFQHVMPGIRVAADLVVVLRRSEPASHAILRGQSFCEVFPAEAVVEGQLVDRPLILREDADVRLQIRMARDRRVVHTNLSWHRLACTRCRRACRPGRAGTDRAFMSSVDGLLPHAYSMPVLMLCVPVTYDKSGRRLLVRRVPLLDLSNFRAVVQSSGDRVEVRRVGVPLGACRAGGSFPAGRCRSSAGCRPTSPPRGGCGS